MCSLRPAAAAALAIAMSSVIVACTGEIRFGTTYADASVPDPPDAGPPPDLGPPDTGRPPPPPPDGGMPDLGCIETYATEWPWPRTAQEYTDRFHSFALAAQPIPCGNPSPCHGNDQLPGQKPFIPRTAMDLMAAGNLDRAINDLFTSLLPATKNGRMIIPIKHVHRYTAEGGFEAVPPYNDTQEMFVDALADSPMVHSCVPVDGGVIIMPDGGPPPDGGPYDGPIPDGPRPDGPDDVGPGDGPDGGPADADVGAG